MKRLMCLTLLVSATLILLPLRIACIQVLAAASSPEPAPTPTKPVVPAVPITYPGDTDEAIIRRAQWIKGAKKEGKLVWYASSALPLGQRIVAEFNKVYPFIKVDYWGGGRGMEVATKLESEFISGRYGVDIVQIGEQQQYPRWREMGIMEKFIDIIPGVKKMDKRMFSSKGDWAIPGNNAIAPHYNTKLVSAAEAPKSWEDLLDPKWKGALAMNRDSMPFWTLALGDGGWGVEKTEDFLTKLTKQNLNWAPSSSGGHALVIAGEFKFLIDGYLPHLFKSREKGAPVDWCRVDPILLHGLTMHLEKKAPNPNAARLFLEWLFSPGGLDAYEKATGYGAVYPGSQSRMAKALNGKRVVWRTEETIFKTIEQNLEEKFSKILGITPKR